MHYGGELISAFCIQNTKFNLNEALFNVDSASQNWHRANVIKVPHFFSKIYLVNTFDYLTTIP